MKVFGFKRDSSVLPPHSTTLRQKLAEIGESQAELAQTIGTSPSRLTQLFNQVSLTEARCRAICRGLMVLAWERGWSKDEVWLLNEHSLLGLPPELDRDFVMAEIGERVEARKQARASAARQERAA